MKITEFDRITDECKELKALHPHMAQNSLDRLYWIAQIEKKEQSKYNDCEACQ